MNGYENDFGPFDGKIWLNSASEGAMPRVAVKALEEAVAWKVKPFELTHQRFQDVPRQLKNSIAGLLNVSAGDVILGNSATYGIHLLAHGIPFKAGDEILLMQNDFPTDILPWLALQDRGVVVRQLPSQGPVIQPGELFAAVTAATRLVCLPHVHTFSGHVVDIETIGRFCRERGIIFVVNFSQSAGCMPLDFEKLPVSAMTSAGFKWLCGPYGTGFCWMTPQLRESLQYQQAFWVNVMTAAELASTGELRLNDDHSSRRFDVFGTANFFNFVPLTASINYLSGIGIAEVQRIIREHVEHFISGLDKTRYTLLSPREPAARSALVVFSHSDPRRNPEIFKTLSQQGIYTAFWKGHVRVAPHIFNTPGDIAKILAVLRAF